MSVTMKAPLEVGICVANLERAVGFYETVLGFSRISEATLSPERAEAAGFGPVAFRMVRMQTNYGERIKLTQIEYSIMKLFMDNPGRALSREDILNAVWGRDYFGELKIVDVNIRRLRIKIEDDTANPTYITTVWGFGYKWGA